MSLEGFLLNITYGIGTHFIIIIGEYMSLSEKNRTNYELAKKVYIFGFIFMFVVFGFSLFQAKGLDKIIPAIFLVISMIAVLYVIIKNPYRKLFSKTLIMENSTYDKAYNETYKNFTNQLSYAIGRYKGYVSNLAPENEKYTKVGVLERINEVKSTRLQLLSVCGKHVKSLLLNAGPEWLDDINIFGEIAPSIMEKLAEAEFKDRV